MRGRNSTLCLVTIVVLIACSCTFASATSTSALTTTNALKTTSNSQQTDIVHVTFEFGTLSAGGLGSVLNGLLPQQTRSFSSVKILLPFVLQPTANDTNANKLLKNLRPVDFAGKNEQFYTVETKEENFTFSVAKFEHDISNETISMYLIRLSDVEFPIPTFDAVEKAEEYKREKLQMYHDLWKLSLYPFGLRSSDLPYKKNVVLNFLGIFNLCFNSVAVRLLDDISSKKETIVNLQGGLTTSVLLFMNTVYKSQHRKWKNVLIFHDYVYFCEAVHAATLESFGIPKSILSDFLVNDYFIPEAYGVRHAQRVVAVSDAMVRSLHTDSSQLVPYPFFGKLRIEFFKAIEIGKMVGINNNVDVKEMSPFLKKELFTEPLTGSHFVSAKTSSKKMVFEELKKVGKFCENSTENSIWGIFVGRIDYFKGADYFAEYVRILRENGVCPVILAPSPQNSTVAGILSELDKNHKIIWLPKGQLQSKYGKKVRLGSDFSFIPSVCESFGLVALESMMYGMPVVSTGVVGLSDTLRRRTEIPKTSDWNSVSQNFPLTQNVKDFISDLSVCEDLKSGFVQNGYQYQLMKGIARYDIPNFSDFSSAISLVVSDLEYLRSSGNLASYITSLTLEAHCKSWDNPRGSAYMYQQMYMEILNEKSLVKKSSQKNKLTVSQMSMFLDGSHNIPVCDVMSIGKDIIPTEWTRKADLPIEFRLIYSEYFLGGKKPMMLLECNHTNHAGRQIAANAIDSDHFPFIFCGIPDTNKLILDIDPTFRPLRLILSELTFEHITVLISEVTTALHNLHKNKLCHGNFTEDSIFVKPSPISQKRRLSASDGSALESPMSPQHPSSLSVFINIFSQNHVDDISACMESDESAFIELLNNLKKHAENVLQKRK